MGRMSSDAAIIAGFMGAATLVASYFSWKLGCGALILTALVPYVMWKIEERR
jgi:hypothetical protein